MAEDTLGGRIRRLRTERGLSLSKVAGDDFSRAFLNQIEMGRSRPSARNLALIAARLGTGVDHLLAGDSPVVERELRLERARILLARGRPGPALAEVAAVVDAVEWPLGADARLCAAAALGALGRDQEARAMLAAVAPAITASGDESRIRRLEALRGVHPDRRRGTGVEAIAAEHARIGDRLHRRGQSAAAIEHYRAARAIFEALAVAADYSPPVKVKGEGAGDGVA